MKIWMIFALGACAISYAGAQESFTPTNDAWWALTYGYKVRCGGDGLVRVTQSTSPTISLKSYNSSGAAVNSVSFEPWTQSKWANYTTYWPDLILDSSSNSYVLTNGPQVPNTSDFWAVKFGTNLNELSSVKISAPSGSTYSYVAERLGSNGDLFVLFQETTGTNINGVVVEVNLSTGTIVGRQLTGGTSDTVTGLAMNGTDSYVCGYVHSTPLATLWKFHSGGSGPDFTVNYSAPSSWTGPPTVMDTQWAAVAADSTGVYLTGNARLNVSVTYGEKAWGSWTTKVSLTTGAALWVPDSYVLDTDPQHGPPYAGFNSQQGVNCGLDGAGDLFVIDQRNEPDAGIAGISVLEYGTDGTAEGNAFFNVGSAPCGEITVDSNSKCRFIAGLDGNALAYLGQYSTSGSSLDVTTHTLNTPFTMSLTEGLSGEAYWGLAGYLYRINM